jgi:hypothetical protein
MTEEPFTVWGKFDLNRELGGCLVVFKTGNDSQVVVDFDAWGADDVLGRQWHSVSNVFIVLSRTVAR